MRIFLEEPWAIKPPKLPRKHRYGRNMKNIEDVKKAKKLLNDLLDILESNKDNNWKRGISAAAMELEDSDGTINPNGFYNARSIYNNITIGGRGFAEYYIWADDEHQRITANESLDFIRLQLWNIFRN